MKTKHLNFHSKGGDIVNALKKVQFYNGKVYFVDWRLRQLRNVDNPHDYEDFRNDEELAACLGCNMEKEIV